MTKSSDQSSDPTKAATQLAARHYTELTELCQQLDKDNSFPIVIIYFMTFQQLLTQMNYANTQPDTTS